MISKGSFFSNLYEMFPEFLKIDPIIKKKNQSVPRVIQKNGEKTSKLSDFVFVPSKNRYNHICVTNSDLICPHNLKPFQLFYGFLTRYPSTTKKIISHFKNPLKPVYVRETRSQI